MNVDKNIFTPVKGKRVFEEVSSRIKELVFEGVLKPGDKLPSESQLARQFSVGRQTIREALRVLELSGFISIQQGYEGGPVITDNISGKITGLFLDAFQLERVSPDEFATARLVIEQAILQAAIDNAETEDIEKLADNVTRAEALIEKKEMATEVNFEFHSLLAATSKNKVYIILERTVSAIHRKLREKKSADFMLSQSVVKTHRSILKAIIDKDPDQAHSLLQKDIRNAARSY